ncbi:unnamed protein product [Symbiodinium microadriaticum]|nr:unnamed protein product [Symbiodinium microadriaticum]CAE7422032.1 unnamed protein product [Symbiodinium sp. KB8]
MGAPGASTSTPGCARRRRKLRSFCPRVAASPESFSSVLASIGTEPMPVKLPAGVYDNTSCHLPARANLELSGEENSCDWDEEGLTWDATFRKVRFRDVWSAAKSIQHMYYDVPDSEAFAAKAVFNRLAKYQVFPMQTRTVGTRVKSLTSLLNTIN